MNGDLSRYLSSLHCANREHWDWGAIKLEAGLYLTQTLPPLNYVTSVRSVIVKDDHVLVAYNDYEEHIFPGGRREQGETLLETVRRECLEETRWEIDVKAMIAVIHCRHQTPKPEPYAYPYPDFCQLIYVSEAITHYPNRMIEDGYVDEVELRSIDVVQNMEMTPNQHILLQTALDLRRNQWVM